MAEIASILSSQFASLDLNQDGALTFDEARAGVPSLTQAQFDALDSNASNGISEAELEAIGENAPPGAFTLTLPAYLSTNKTLEALITSPAIDPEGDAVSYRFSWFVRQEGDLVFSPFKLSFDMEIASRILPSLTTAGDVFYCQVTATDGISNGPTVTSNWCSILCAPPAPANVQASDGAFVNKVKVVWDAAPTAESYEVYRSTTGNRVDAYLIGTTQLTTFDDFEAPRPRIITTTDPGCELISSTEIQYRQAHYWIQAISDCASSVDSTPDRGFVGHSMALENREVFEKVLPAAEATSGRQKAQLDSILAIRMRHALGIEPLSVWGAVYTASGSEYHTADIIPVIEGDMRDIWVVFQPAQLWLPYDVLSFTVGCTTPGGEPLQRVTYEFDVESAEEYTARMLGKDAGSVEVAEAPVGLAPALLGAAGPQYVITPDAPFGPAQEIQLPVPQGIAAGSLRLYYYHAESAAWVAAENVEGWLIPGSVQVMEEAGAAYVSFRVLHGGTVQLAEPADAQPTTQGAAMGGGAGTLALMIASGLALLVPRFRRQHYRRGSIQI